MSIIDQAAAMSAEAHYDDLERQLAASPVITRASYHPGK
jgi:hypothetical protein